MKKLFFLILIYTSISCSNTDEKPAQLVLSGGDYIVFGRFYGFCGGEQCIEIYKLTATTLSEDSLDMYPLMSNNTTNFVPMPDQKFLLAQDLSAFFPISLLQETSTVFGTPDAYDQGGMIVEYNIDGVQKRFYFDNNIQVVPDQYHIFLNKINQKIQLIQ